MMRTADHRILITADLPGLSTAQLQPLSPKRWRGHERDSLLRAAAGCDALLVTANERVDEALLSAAGAGLRVVGTYSVGTDHVDLEACARAGVRVVTAAGTLASAMAEHTFGLMLACARRIVEADRFVRTGAEWRWEPDAFLGAQLAGHRLGVLGMGSIGQAVARRARAFDMEVHCLRHRPEAVHAPDLIPHATLGDLARVSDFLTIHVPLTSGTDRMVDKAVMAALPSGAVIVNTSRGRVVAQSDMIELLESGHLGGVALDVFEEEPLVPDELRRNPRAVLTPHIGSATTTTRQGMTAEVLRRIKLALA
uniref:D-isomer specific 2-hydroxyacid dehydrogenase NAD-binding protein n=2 Tax=unclassified Streptomyces TaxID=2593676 RepID=U5YNW3_9ACTN|nr:D-isomer specific 2-hydroxyacid dehydrogenase NAD-binding protein [Streptomyces sp. MMG1662]